MFPIIPILAILAIIGGISTLSWYSSLTKEQQRRADTLALKWFGKKFTLLAESQQKRIKQFLDTKV